MSDRIRQLKSLVNDPRFRRNELDRDLHIGPLLPQEPPLQPESDYEAMRMMQARDVFAGPRDGRAGLYHREQTTNRAMPSGMNDWIKQYGHTYIPVDEPAMPPTPRYR
jgi:hypothetical protein